MGNISSDKNTRTAEGRKDVAVRCVPKFVNTFREGAKGTEHHPDCGCYAVSVVNWVAIDILSLKNDALYFITRLAEERRRRYGIEKVFAGGNEDKRKERDSLSVNGGWEGAEPGRTVMMRMM